MATKKAAKKVAEVAVEMTSAEKLKANYEKLSAMNIAVQEEMQKAYRFARDNSLIYTPPSVVYDSDDTSQDRDGWDSSYC